MNFRDFKEKYQKSEVVEPTSSSPENPVLSVLIQTFQQKDFIRDCLESIINQQTNFDFEILLGEDGSEDGTREICVEYAKKYPDKIRLFLHNRQNQILVNGEFNSNFNAIYNFFSAKGNFIAFCEGDDVWGDPYKLQKQVDFLQTHKQYSFSYHSYKFIDENGRILVDEDIIQPKQDLEKEDLLNVVHHPLLLTICFRNILPGIPTEMVEVINVDTFLISLLGEFGKAKFQDEIKPSLYRKHSGGIWSKRFVRKKYRLKILLYGKLSTYHKNRDLNLSRSFRKKKMNILRMQIMFDFKNGNIIPAAGGIVHYIKEKLN